jgi:hypothetical protein
VATWVKLNSETLVIKNESKILTTTKPNRFGNVLLGGLLFGGAGAIVAGSISSEKTTEVRELDKLILEIVLDCEQHPVHRMDCTQIPGRIEFFQMLLELVMMDADIKNPPDKVDIKDHVRMLRLKLERENKANA